MNSIDVNARCEGTTEHCAVASWRSRCSRTRVQHSTIRRRLR